MKQAVCLIIRWGIMHYIYRYIPVWLLHELLFLTILFTVSYALIEGFIASCSACI